MSGRRAWQRLSNRAPSIMLRAFVALAFVFMIGPIVITAATSFNPGEYSQFPPRGFSLRWWHEAFTREWFDPLLFSFGLAIVTTLISVALALPLAFGLTRHKFAGREAIATMTFGPIVLPHLVIGIAILQFAVFLGLGDYLGLPALLAGHIVICLPYAVRTIGISLQTMPPNIERAAMNLGASPAVVLREMVMPLIKSGIFAGGVFAFIHSFNDINLSVFLSSPTQQVINVKILGHLEYGFTPVVAAVAVITFAIPLAIVYAIERSVGIGDFLYGGRAKR